MKTQFESSEFNDTFKKNLKLITEHLNTPLSELGGSGKYEIQLSEEGRGKIEKVKFVSLNDASKYIQDRWQGSEYMDGIAGFHTDYSSYTLVGFTLKDIGTVSWEDGHREFEFSNPITEDETQDAADDGEHYATAARDTLGRVSSENINYSVERTKEKVTKIIAKLKGSHSSAFTKAIETWTRINELNVELKRMEEEFKQAGLRDKLSALFGSEFEYTTRVVETVSLYEIMLTAQPVVTTDKSVAWSKVYEDLATRLTPELLKVAEAIKEKHSSLKKTPVPALKLKIPADLGEGVGDMLSNFLKKLKQWGISFDRKLKTLSDEVNRLQPESNIFESTFNKHLNRINRR